MRGAPLLCAGLTTFSALRNAPAKAGEMPYLVHQSAVDEDEFQPLCPQPDDLLANHPMTLRRQCSALKALVPKIGAMHIGQR
jgi:hypothetical protein